jgi:hypothetical protein
MRMRVQACLAAYSGSCVATLVAWCLLKVPNTTAVSIGLYSYNSAGACAAIVMCVMHPVCAPLA